MMKIGSGILKSMSIYVFSNVLNAAIPFLLLPVLTNYLSPQDYGVLSNFNATINLMIPLIGINVMSSVQVQFLKEEVNFRDYVSSVLRFNILLTALFSILVFAFRSQLERMTGLPDYFLYCISIYAFFNTVIEVLLAIWRMEDKAISYGLFRVLRTALEVSLVLIFVIGFGWHFEGTITGMIIAYSIGALAASFLLFQKNLLFGTNNRSYLKHAISYGVPLIPHTLSATAIMYADKLILTHYHGLSSNGIYSVGFMIGQVIGLLQNSFNQAWVPWVFQKLKKGEEGAKLKMVKITYFYFVAILLMVLVLWLFVPFIYSFLGKEFQSGMGLVLFIGLGFAFNGMYKMVSVYLFYLERTMIIAMISMGVAALNITLSLMLIPEKGVEGAAMSNVVSMFALFVITWIVSGRMMKMPWFLKNE